MSIKSKSVAVFFVIFVVLITLCGMMLWTYKQNNRQVAILGASLGDLYAVRKTRLAITRQIAQAMDYFVSLNQRDLELYREFSLRAEMAFDEWREAIRRSEELGQDKTAEKERAKTLAARHIEVNATIEEAFELTEAQSFLQAYDLLENDVEDWMNYVLVEEIDWAVEEEIREVHEAYDEVVTRLGAMPWEAEKGVRQIRIARYSMLGLLFADTIGINIERQYKELADYLASGDEQERREYEEYKIVVEIALRDWVHAIRQEAELFGGYSEVQSRVNDVKESYFEFLELGDKAIELLENEDVEGMKSFVTNTLDPFHHDVLNARIHEEMDLAKRRIDYAHKELLRITLFGGVKNVLLIVIISSVIVFILISMIRGILTSLAELEIGTQHIRMGELNYRIGLRTKDELGQLAWSFDRMAEDLQETRTEIIRSKEYTDNILRSMSDMLVVVSPDGLIQTANDALCNSLGYGEKDLIGQPVDRIIVGGLPSEGSDAKDADEQTGAARDLEMSYRMKDGPTVPVSFSSSPMRDEVGAVEGIVCVAQDITERKRAEETLRVSEQKFRRLSQEFHALLDAIPDSLILLSPDLKVLWSNKGAASVFGKDGSQLSGQSCYNLWHGQSFVCKDCPVMKSFRTGKEAKGELSTANGRVLDVRAFPIKDEKGNVSSVIEVAVDITERIKLQADAMQAAHLASLGELAAGVAHEINNPINSVINYAQILIDEPHAKGTDRDIAKRILQDSDRIANIVRSLLSFARSSQEEKVVVHIGELLSNSLALTQTQIRKDGISLEVDAPPGLPEIVAHPQQIEQVFLNVINNARYALNQKYPGTHEDKVLEIASETVAGGDGPHVRVTFRDHGMGIPADIRDKVMNPFFSTKPRGVGTGLGLSISHGIISDHGGSLTIESAEGGYTKIIIDLPARRGA